MVVETQTLIAEGSTWKYLDDGSDQGTIWSGVTFDDSSWPEGPAELGFGDGDEATVLDDGFITYYFRKTIAIGGDVVSDVELRFKRDDSIAVYINGTLVEANNLPSNWDYLSGATTTVPNSDENAWNTRTISGSHFVPGTNVVAVEIHNRSTSSSDITFDLSLVGDVQLSGGGGGGALDTPAAPDEAAAVVASSDAVTRPRRRPRTRHHFDF